jgi:hypothetical protein
VYGRLKDVSSPFERCDDRSGGVKASDDDDTSRTNGLDREISPARLKRWNMVSSNRVKDEECERQRGVFNRAECEECDDDDTMMMPSVK